MILFFNYTESQMSTAIEWRTAVFMHVAAVDWTDVPEQLHSVQLAYTNVCFTECANVYITPVYIDIPSVPGKAVRMIQ